MPDAALDAASDAGATACDTSGDCESDPIARNPDTYDVGDPETADLRRVVDAWPELSEPIRHAILALVQTATKQDDR